MTANKLEIETAKLSLLRDIASDVWRQDWSTARKATTEEFLRDYIRRIESEQGRLIRCQRTKQETLSAYPG